MAIREQAQRMVLLVDNLLDMARLQAGRAWIAARTGNRWRNWWARRCGCSNSLRDHRCVTGARSRTAAGRLRRDLIEQVLVNLLQNAAQHARQGTVIRMTARATGDQLTVTVWDEGPGLPSEDSKGKVTDKTPEKIDPRSTSGSTDL